MKSYLLGLMSMVCLAGCGGQYTLSSGDHLAAVGTEAPVVVRLQRNDFFVLNLAVKDALIRFRLADGLERAAYTDKLGYAGTTVQAPGRPGRYTLRLDHTDIEGEQVVAEAPFYVLDPGRQAVAVALDDLPTGDSYEAKVAASYLNDLAETASIIYLTKRSVRYHQALHAQLEQASCPDGPILLWQRQYWHIVRQGKYKVPRVVVETRLVSQLGELRKILPGLSVGICGSEVAARAFNDAGMKAVVVGPAGADSGDDGRESWDDLRRRGI